MSKSEFLKANTRLKAWCKTALEFWAQTAADPRGGYAELLRMDGSPDFDHVRRVRVQARQAYVYAHAGALGWYNDSKAACDQAWDFLTGPGFEGADFVATGPRGCAHLVNGDGSMHDDMRDTYAQAFVLLAGAWRYRAFGDQAALDIANETLEFLDANLAADNGGWYEALSLPASDIRRANPHMHLFESMLGLYGATQDKRYLAYANRLYGLFTDVFFDTETGGVLEHFYPDWTPEKNTVPGDGGPFEPGHMMEWCWLLRVYQKLSGVDVSKYADALYDGAIKYGWNEKLGLLCNSVNIDGSAANSNLRTWPQTELLKASIAQAACGQTDKLAIASAAINTMFDTYLNVDIEGGWADELDPQGNVISDTMPTSTFYHLFCAAAEADALAQDLL